MLLLSVGLAPGMLGAQGVSGRARERETGTPVPGVVVSLSDSSRRVVARTLTDQDGAYRLNAGPGRYSITTLRIGFHPETVDSVIVGLKPVLHDFELLSVPFRLGSVRVNERARCGDGIADPDAFAVWEQARAALVATEITSRNRAVRARLIAYQQQLDPIRRRVMEQSESVVEGLTSAPWRSLPLDSARRHGYVREAGDGSVEFFAPDLKILISDEFLEDHCISFGQGEPATLRLRFSPTRERRNIPEIQGEALLDTGSLRLRSIRFSYIQLPRAFGSLPAEGEMHFAPLTRGGWVISRWTILMPVIERVVVGFRGFGMSRPTTMEFRHAATKAEGAYVALITAGADTLYSHPPMRLAGVVLDSITQRPVGGTLVSLGGVPRTSVTDNFGRFYIDGVLPGNYLLKAQTPELMRTRDAHVLPVLVRGDSPADIAVSVPRPEHLVLARCGRVLPDGQGVIIGEVTAGKRGVPNARVTAQWQDFVIRGESIHRINRLADAQTDSGGVYRICGVPLSTNVELSATLDTGDVRYFASFRDVRLGELLLVHHLALSPVEEAATLVGMVVDSETLRGLAGVEIALADHTRRTYTDSAGAFRLDNLAGGALRLDFRRVGYFPAEVRMEANHRRATTVEVRLARVATLDTVRTIAPVLPTSFEEHRRLGLGQFMGSEDLRRHDGRRLAEVLTALRGVGVVRSRGSQATIVSSRGPTSINSACRVLEGTATRVCGCVPLVFLDRVMLYNGVSPDAPDLNRLAVDAIEGVEYYAGTAQVPAAYSGLNSQCGVLILHSRRE